MNALKIYFFVDFVVNAGTQTKGVAESYLHVNNSHTKEVCI